MDSTRLITPKTKTKTEYSVEQPLNRESPIQNLIENFLTPPDIAYDRNHGPVPHLAADTHSIRVDGLVANPLTLTIDDLLRSFPQHEVICALQCAGNRRHTMRTMLKEVDGIDWQDAAVMNCKWRGPRLKDVLRMAGFDVLEASRRVEKHGSNNELHVAFSCYQVPCQEDDWFGASVPLRKCVEEGDDMILALEMNDQPLTPNHGYPVRIVLPGITGCRWVKWLDQITIQRDYESRNFYQQRDYKVLPPEAVDKTSAEKFWSHVPPLYETAVNSAIASPADGGTVMVPPSGLVEVRGYAVPHGDGGPVTKVEVSVDAGRTWTEATLDFGPSSIVKGQTRKWSWLLWKAIMKVEKKGPGQEILSRATDSAGNVQPEHSQWNLRGVGYHGYGRAQNVTFI